MAPALNDNWILEPGKYESATNQGKNNYITVSTAQNYE
jgi:hypothetical protein